MYRLVGEQILPESLQPADRFSAKPALTGILFARSLLQLQPGSMSA